MKAGIECSAPSQKYQVKPRCSSWFNPVYLATTAQKESEFFRLYQLDILYRNRRLIVSGVNKCKHVLNKSLFAGKMRHRI